MAVQAAVVSLHWCSAGQVCCLIWRARGMHAVQMSLSPLYIAPICHCHTASVYLPPCLGLCCALWPFVCNVQQHKLTRMHQRVADLLLATVS